METCRKKGFIGMEADQRKIAAIQINNQTFHVRCDDPERVTRLAQHVDERMSEVESQTPTVDSLRVAILAALNIADEYFELRDRYESVRNKVASQSKRMIEMLEPFSDD